MRICYESSNLNDCMMIRFRCGITPQLRTCKDTERFIEFHLFNRRPSSHRDLKMSHLVCCCIVVEMYICWSTTLFHTDDCWMGCSEIAYIYPWCPEGESWSLFFPDIWLNTWCLNVNVCMLWFSFHVVAMYDLVQFTLESHHVISHSHHSNGFVQFCSAVPSVSSDSWSKCSSKNSHGVLLDS